MNGLLFGYCIEKGYVSHIYRNRTARTIVTILCLYIALSFTVIFMRRSDYFGDLPVFSALEHSISGTVVSLILIYMFTFLMENNGIINRVFSSRYWRPIRTIQQTSYLLHPVLAYWLSPLMPQFEPKYETLPLALFGYDSPQPMV
ncbi:unnamed protein product, partial [Medioppia subpectinata]